MAFVRFTAEGPQEVGRGELHAMVVALERTCCSVVYVTDRKSVWQLWRRRAWERLQLQQWTGAEDDCTVAVTLNPRNAKAWWAGDGGARSRCG